MNEETLKMLQSINETLLRIEKRMEATEKINKEDLVYKLKSMGMKSTVGEIRQWVDKKVTAQ